MITPEYCRQMASYNATQNRNIGVVVDRMDAASLSKDRGAFFGSIHATLNHLLWADMLWIGRFDGGGGPAIPPDAHKEMTQTIAQWQGERVRLDARISLWADRISALDLVGDLNWRAIGSNEEEYAAIAFCVARFFNHQTHHRGQVHAMLTAAGQTTQATDLMPMPEG